MMFLFLADYMKSDTFSRLSIVGLALCNGVKGDEEFVVRIFRLKVLQRISLGTVYNIFRY